MSTANEPIQPQEEDEEFTLATYQWVTVGQLLERLGLVLKAEDLKIILGQKTSFYYQLLLPSMMNVLNGIVLDQTKEYRLFLQKLLIDFLMSGEADPPPEAPVSTTHEAIEKERVYVINVSKELDQIQQDYYANIVKVQCELKEFVAEWKQYLHKVYGAMTDALKGCQIDCPFSEAALHLLFLDARSFTIQETGWKRIEQSFKTPLSSEGKEILKSQWGELAPYEKRFGELISALLPLVRDQRTLLNQYRHTFHEDIVRVQDLLYILSGPQVNKQKDYENRERLNFDPTIGRLEEHPQK